MEIVFRHFLAHLDFEEVASWIERRNHSEGPPCALTRRLLHWRVLPQLLRSLAFALLKLTLLLAQVSLLLNRRVDRRRDACVPLIGLLDGWGLRFLRRFSLLRFSKDLNSLWAKLQLLELDDTTSVLEVPKRGVNRRPRISYGGLAGEGPKRRRRRGLFSAREKERNGDSLALAVSLDEPGVFAGDEAKDASPSTEETALQLFRPLK